MLATPGSEVSGGPRTYVGLWLRALLRGESDDYRRLTHKLNGGEKGWNDDEPAVVEAACQLMVRRYFSSYRHVSITALMSDMRDRIAKQRTPSRQEDMEAVVRDALDESTAAAPSDIKRSELYRIRGAVTVNIADILRLDFEAVDQLVVEAERIAVARGYRPPLAVKP
jgi:hypothetical protein